MVTPSTQPTNSRNVDNKTYRQESNQFDLSYDHFTTASYGMLTPHFAMNVVEGDVVPLNSKHKVLTHTLKSPLFSGVNMHKDYFLVPNRAILPRNWEIIYKNPVQGDDVPEDANCFVESRVLVSNLMHPILHNIDMLSPDLSALQFTNISRYFILLELFFSYGSLLSRVGYNLAPLFRWYRLDSTGSRILDGDNLSFDQFIEQRFIPWFTAVNPQLIVNGHSYILDSGDYSAENLTSPKVSIHRFLELMRQYPDFELKYYNGADLPNLRDLFYGSDFVDNLVPNLDLVFDVDVYDAENTINFDRVIAYHLAYAQFYTNDHVDFDYTADMYRSSMETLTGLILNNPYGGDPMPSDGSYGVSFFEYNGSLRQYDVFSSHNLTKVVSNLNTLSPDTYLWTTENHLAYWQNLLGLEHSLRYGDYYSGSRVNVLAVGEASAAVIDNSVSAIDQTRSILMQRFLHAVNRGRNTFNGYIQMLSGKTPTVDATVPRYLAHTTSGLGGMEVENTGENQGNIVTLLRGRDEQYSFTCEVDEPGIILGITSFSVKRLYSRSLDRFALKKDRFDMFNKFFQYDGDQSIYLVEKDASFLNTNKGDLNFSYTGRHMEYKQRVSIATGGAVEFLPAYAFVTDNAEAQQNVAEDTNLTPEFIRASSTEFNRFYASLANYSLAGFFHFIIYYNNECNASRQMALNPSIL